MSTQEQIEELRAQRAAEWLEILHGEDAGRHAEFLQWVTESPLNLDAFLKLEALSRETRAVLRSSEIDIEALLKPVDPTVLAFRESRAAGKPAAVSRRRSLWLTSAAAGLVFTAIAALWTYQHFFRWTEYTTGTEQKTIALADGSWIYLNARSSLAVRLSLSERSLRLAEGEALFDVARDTRRPFRVRTADVVVEALGTQFNVNARQSGTRVAVIEGKVRVSRAENLTSGGVPPDAASGTATATPLEAGQAARVSPRGTIERDSGVDLKEVTAWSQPELIFDGTSLEDAVALFNHQRRAKRLRLEGVPADSHHYSGMFNATDSETFAAMLARERDLEVSVGEGEIVIRRR